MPPIDDALPARPAPHHWRSIVFTGPGPPADLDATPEPDHFHDLNLDQVVERVTAGHEFHRLLPYFRRPLGDVMTIRARQDAFRDLENPDVREGMEQFAAGLRGMRQHLERAHKLHYPRQKQRWFLESVLQYCATIETAAEQFQRLPLRSAGLQAARDDVVRYAGSETFRALGRRARRLEHQLATVRYALLVRGDKVTAGSYDDEADYRVRVLETFARFQQGATRDYNTKFTDHPDMDHVEAQILDLVASLNGSLFAELAAFTQQEANFVADGIESLDRELHFYLAWVGLLDPLRSAGLPVCYPAVSLDSKDTEARDTYDLALAAKLLDNQQRVVVNDFYLTGAERILVVSGPNQGGKTTLARTFGQLHYLAALGCPVPGSTVRVHLPDQILTQFEREEKLETLRGKLQDDLQRIHEVLDRASPDSVIILNEIFNSTTLDDARALSVSILGAIGELDALSVCVSFIDELSRLNEKTVSMVSTVVENDPATRTFKLIRKPADGRAYALAIAEKYGLTYQRLRERVES